MVSLVTHAAARAIVILSAHAKDPYTHEHRGYGSFGCGLRMTSRSRASGWRWAALAVSLVLLIGGCAPAPGTPAASAPGAPAGGAASAAPARPLVIVLRVEPPGLISEQLSQGGSVFRATDRLFNAGLAILDDHAVPQPYLATSLPQLNTDSWMVNADGTMQTTYHLKPNAT